MENILSINDLNSLLKKHLEEDSILKNITVSGEVSNLTLHKSGHIYFSLKDNTSSIKCMIWKFNTSKISLNNFKEGSKVIAKGRITFYPPTGQISFEVSDIRFEGIGELQKIFDERFEEYQNKGYFDQIYKKKIPKFPKNIGIVTAETGDAIKDIIRTIKRRYPLANIFLFPSAVQGVGAENEIAKKINMANNFPTTIDVLIVGRGGGSYEDLYAFNEVVVIEAIYKSRIPIISAVGHEPDVLLSDYVADLRASTPTAAAELCTQDKNAITNKLNGEIKLFSEILKSKLRNFNNNLNNLNEKIVFNFKNKIAINKKEIELIKNNLTKNLVSIYKDNKNIFNNLEKQIEILDPTKPLKKGFALIKNKSSNLLTNIEKIKNENSIIIKMKDGEINLKIEKE